MADVVSLARSIASNEQPSIHSMGVGVSAMSQPVIADINEVASAWYLRLDAEDKPGVMASLTQCLSQCGIGIESLIQKPESAALAKVPVILMTDEAPTRAIEQAIADIEALPSVGGPVTCLRVEKF
jgi:homoserine dehydrogenase